MICCEMLDCVITGYSLEEADWAKMFLINILIISHKR